MIKTDDTTCRRKFSGDKTDVFGRWVSDMHCLWRYCEKRSCQRNRACGGDIKHCLHFMPLVPCEAREFLFRWDSAQAAGLSFEEMVEEYAEEWHTLLAWQEMVRDTLPENRWKERLRLEAEQRAKLNGQGRRH